MSRPQREAAANFTLSGEGNMRASSDLSLFAREGGAAGAADTGTRAGVSTANATRPASAVAAPAAPSAAVGRRRPPLALREPAVVPLTGAEHGSALRALAALLPELDAVAAASQTPSASAATAVSPADGTLRAAAQSHAA